MKPREGDRDTEFVSPQEVRSMLDFGATKTYSILKELPSYKIGRSVRVRRHDLEQWLEDNRSEPCSQEEKTA